MYAAPLARVSSAVRSSLDIEVLNTTSTTPPLPLPLLLLLLSLLLLSVDDDDDDDGDEDTGVVVVQLAAESDCMYLCGMCVTLQCEISSYRMNNTYRVVQQ